jgi:hypothetical protein
MYEGSATQDQKPAEKPKYEPHPNHGTVYQCCEKARRVSCVCRISWSCPVHGSWCVGSHD